MADLPHLKRGACGFDSHLRYQFPPMAEQQTLNVEDVVPFGLAGANPARGTIFPAVAEVVQRLSEEQEQVRSTRTGGANS